MKIRWYAVYFMLMALFSCSTDKTEFYVSPTGDDNNPGTKKRPFLTFSKAKETVRQTLLDNAKDKNICVYFHEGRYFFDKTIVFQDSIFCSDNHKIIFTAYKNEKPVFSSDKLLTDWQKPEQKIPYLPKEAQGKIWVNKVPDGIDASSLRFLCSDSVSLPIAISGYLFTDEDESVSNNISDLPEEMDRKKDVPPTIEELSTFVFPKKSLREWENVKDIEILTRPHYAWDSNILPLESVNSKNNTARTAITGTYKICRVYHEPFYPNLWVQNAIDYLDKPGEWVVNSVEKKIYYWPNEEKPGNVYCPMLQEFIRIEGNEENNEIIKNIEFRGITFAHGKRDTWDQHAIGLQHDWALYDNSDALVRFIDSENCIIDQCTFTTSGGGGVRFDFYSQQNKVTNCKFNNLGGTPILLAGYGPGRQNVNKNNEIVNNEINDFGQSYLHSPGIFLWQSGHNKIAHNLVYNAPYNGIAVSGPRPMFFDKKLMSNRRELTGTIYHDNIEKGSWDDWDKLFEYFFSENNVIENNELHHVVLTLDDGNAIYLSGTGNGNIVRRNYIHDNISAHRHGAIRGDGFSKNITITENIIYRFARYGIVTRYPNTITNNYFIDYIPTEKFNGERHDMLAFLYIIACGPVKGTIIKNNLYYQSSGVAEPFVSWTYINPFNLDFDKDEWPPKLSDCDMDSNLYFATGVPHSCREELEKRVKQGVDSSSVVADPEFIGLENAGFQLNENSPARSLGIKQIDFENIGLLK